MHIMLSKRFTNWTKKPCNAAMAADLYDWLYNVALPAQCVADLKGKHSKGLKAKAAKGALSDVMIKEIEITVNNGSSVRLYCDNKSLSEIIGARILKVLLVGSKQAAGKKNGQDKDLIDAAKMLSMGDEKFEKWTGEDYTPNKPLVDDAAAINTVKPEPVKNMKPVVSATKPTAEEKKKIKEAIKANKKARRDAQKTSTIQSSGAQIVDASANVAQIEYTETVVNDKPIEQPAAQEALKTAAPDFTEQTSREYQLELLSYELDLQQHKIAIEEAEIALQQHKIALERAKMDYIALQMRKAKLMREMDSVQK